MIEVIAKTLYEVDIQTIEDMAGWKSETWEEYEDKATYLKAASAVLQAISDHGYSFYKSPHKIDWGPNPSKKDTP